MIEVVRALKPPSMRWPGGNFVSVPFRRRKVPCPLTCQTG